MKFSVTKILVALCCVVLASCGDNKVSEKEARFLIQDSSGRFFDVACLKDIPSIEAQADKAVINGCEVNKNKVTARGAWSSYYPYYSNYSYYYYPASSLYYPYYNTNYSYTYNYNNNYSWCYNYLGWNFNCNSYFGNSNYYNQSGYYWQQYQYRINQYSQCSTCYTTYGSSYNYANGTAPYNCAQMCAYRYY